MSTPSYNVGDRVSLHAYKAKRRRMGTIVKVTPARVVVEVHLGDEWRTRRQTTRAIGDPDLQLVRAAVQA